jgi:hypothetical protein
VDKYISKTYKLQDGVTVKQNIQITRCKNESAVYGTFYIAVLALKTGSCKAFLRPRDEYETIIFTYNKLK